MSAEPMSVGRLRRLSRPIPDEAELHGYLHSWGVTIQAEWVADGQIQNPVLLRIPFEIRAGSAVEEPDSWLTHQADAGVWKPKKVPPVDLMAALEESLRRAAASRWNITDGPTEETP